METAESADHFCRHAKRLSTKPPVYDGLLSSKNIKALHEQKVIGNLAFTFYLADGSTGDIDLNSWLTGLNRSVASRLFLVAIPAKLRLYMSLSGPDL